jgi:hypothetical protein
MERRDPFRALKATLTVAGVGGLVAYAAWNLYRAVTRGIIYGRHGLVSRATEPVTFWLNTAIYGGLLLLVAGCSIAVVWAWPVARGGRVRLDRRLREQLEHPEPILEPARSDRSAPTPPRPRPQRSP